MVLGAGVPSFQIFVMKFDIVIGNKYFQTKSLEELNGFAGGNCQSSMPENCVVLSSRVNLIFSNS